MRPRAIHIAAGLAAYLAIAQTRETEAQPVNSEIIDWQRYLNGLRAQVRRGSKLLGSTVELFIPVGDCDRSGPLRVTGELDACTQTAIEIAGALLLDLGWLQPGEMFELPDLVHLVETMGSDDELASDAARIVLSAQGIS